MKDFYKKFGCLPAQSTIGIMLLFGEESMNTTPTNTSHSLYVLYETLPNEVQQAFFTGSHALRGNQVRTRQRPAS